MKKNKFILQTIFLFISLGINAQDKGNHDYCIHSKTKNYNSLKNIEKSVNGKNIDIKYHRLHFDIDPAELYVKGSNTVYFKSLESLNSISFDFFHSLKADSIFYHGQKINSTHSSNNLVIQLETEIPTETLDSITIYYQGVPSGEGSTKGFTQGYHNSVPVIYTLSEPYGGREWWPCKQDLDDKIDSIDVLVTTAEEYKAASNGKLVGSITKNGKTTYHWKHRHSIAAYLIAIAVTNYVEFSDYYRYSETDSVEILNYVYPENLESVKNSVKNTKIYLQIFSEMFILYPYANEKYGHAEFGWNGGMEHQTMSFMGSWNENVIIHELAHQWFGDYITCSSWKDIWLNEGFASYLEMLAQEKYRGMETYNNALLYNFNRALSEPHGSVYVDDTTNIGRIFNSNLSYAKGASVLHMLRRQIGDEIFFKALKNYLNDPKLSDGYASTTHLKEHFQALTEKNLDPFFEDWIYGKGFPTYTLKWQQNESLGMEFSLEQAQSDLSVDFFEMKVPIKVYNSLSDTVLYLEHSFSGQQFSVPIDFVANTVTIDPDNYILKAPSTVLTIREIESDKMITIAPNPVNDKCRIVLNKSFNFQSIEIFSSNGQMIKKLAGGFYSNVLEIDVKDLPKGSYILKLTNDMNVFSEKFIIDKK